MGYFQYRLPPPAPGNGPRTLPSLDGLRPVGGAASLEAEMASERRRADDDGGRVLMRTHRLAWDEAERRRDAWLGEGGARIIDSPAGVQAWERTRPDTLGGRRRQRLAHAPHGRESTLVHWSVPDPPEGSEEERWEELIARIAGGGRDGGWLA